MNRIEAQALQPAARLLLACSLDRRLLRDERLRALDKEVHDWDGFLAQAAHHFILPVVQERLSDLEEVLPSPVRAELDKGVLASVYRNLRIAGMLGQLHRSWLRPSRIRYLAVKGVSLAQRYYGGLSQRSCRDLDIVVDRPRFAPTVAHLCATGHVPCHPFELPEDPARHTAHIEAVCDLNREVSLRSPSGEIIDLHRDLDLTGADFPTDRLLDRAETIRISGDDIPVLSTADLFVYVCYHHSRHQWSRLHWVTDLGRIASAPDFNLVDIGEAARRAGMEKLVAACLEMPGLLARFVEGGMPKNSGLAARMALECVTFLQPGAQPPELAHHSRIDDPLFRWRQWFAMTGTEWRQRKGMVRHIRAVGRSLRPSWQAYLDLPLPKRLRWLYMPWRFGAHLVRYMPLPMRKRKRPRRRGG